MQTIVNLGTGGADLNGQNGSTTSPDSNDVLLLDWPGDNGGNYVYLPGVAGNYLSVPDEAALDITGDIDIRVKVALDDWTPAATGVLIGKLNFGGNNHAFNLNLSASGVLIFAWTENGTTYKSATSTTTVSVADGGLLWVRASFDADNDASGNDVSFFTSNDGISWSQLGSTITTAGTSSIYNSSMPVTIGAQGFGNANSSGKIYRAQILNGINGTTVLDVDCSQITSGADTSFTALTGQTVSINRSTSGRKSVAVVSRVWLFGTDDRIEVSHNALIDFSDTDSFSLFIVARRWATDLFAGLVTKQADYDATRQGYGIAHYTESGGNKRAYMSISDGSINESYLSTVSEQAGETYCLSMVRDRFTDFVHYYGNGTLLDTDADDVGDLRNSNTFYIGRYASVARYADAEILAVAVFRRALTSTEVSQLSDYYTSRWS